MGLAVGLTAAQKAEVGAELTAALMAEDYRNLRCLSLYLMKLLQKRIIFPGFCFPSVKSKFMCKILDEIARAKNA
ncbi:hypothetical protein ABU162_28090 [Paenibacillus thiaminolyticus]|uniref:hypothetical protein n=1 Tax=Paenibacillus thiaminolyticus TaxID=49283 RepID=UPI0035A69019